MLMALLAASSHVFSDERIEETAATLNATVEECHRAVPFFVKQVFLLFTSLKDSSMA